VFPCVVGGKAPATPHGHKDASADVAQIDKWWGEADYNLAYSPEDAGQCVADIDGPEGAASWDALQLTYGDVTTCTIRTPSGGHHAYFTGSLPATASKIGAKIDTRGRGSYVLVPPSHVNGREYEYVNPAPMAPVPAWVVEAAGKGREKQIAPAHLEPDHPANLDRGAAWLARQGEPPFGQGNDKMYQAAAMLGDLGVSQDTAHEWLTDWNDTWSSPMDPAEVETCVWSGFKNRSNDLGAYAVPTESGSEAFAGLLALDLPVEPPAPFMFPLHTVAEIMARPPREWLIEDMIVERSVGMIYGPFDSFKTFMAVTLALPVALTRQVVYIAGEDEDGAAEKANAWVRLHEAGDHGLRIVDEMPLAGSANHIDQFVKDMRAQHCKPALVIIDTAARAMLGLEENSSKDMGLFVAAMDRIRKSLGCAVLGVHHTGKNGEMRGSTAIPGGMDFLAKVEADEALPGVKVTMVKQKKGARRTKPWFYTATPFAGSLVFKEVSADTWGKLTDGDDRLSPKNIAGFIRAAGGQDVTTHTLAVRVCGLEAPAEEVSQTEKALSRLAKTGRYEAYCLGVGQGLRWSLPGAA